jgi:hypothetical protein
MSIMRKIILIVVLAFIAQGMIAQKEKSGIILAWCGTKELKEVRFGCLEESPRLIFMDGSDQKVLAYKMALINKAGDKLILNASNAQAPKDIMMTAKTFRPLQVEIFDVIVSDGENTMILEDRFKYPVVME